MVTRDTLYYTFLVAMWDLVVSHWFMRLHHVCNTFLSKPALPPPLLSICLVRGSITTTLANSSHRNYIIDLAYGWQECYIQSRNVTSDDIFWMMMVGIFGCK